MTPPKPQEQKDWVLVPREPTREMLNVSVPQPMAVKGSETDTIRWHLYRAMVNSAPLPAMESEGEGSEGEFAWLIEGPNQTYLGIWEHNRTFTWHMDHKRAMRFSRFVDAGSAMMVAKTFQPELFDGGTWERTNPVEHGWHGIPARPARTTDVGARETADEIEAGRWTYGEGETCPLCNGDSDECPHSRQEIIASIIASALPKGSIMTEEQIKHMVQRFLGWRLPKNFNPDAGISFKADYNEHMPFGPQKHEPTGTNLFDAMQADAMVRYMLDGIIAHTSAPAALPTLSEEERELISRVDMMLDRREVVNVQTNVRLLRAIISRLTGQRP